MLRPQKSEVSLPHPMNKHLKVVRAPGRAQAGKFLKFRKFSSLTCAKNTRKLPYFPSPNSNISLLRPQKRKFHPHTQREHRKVARAPGRARAEIVGNFGLTCVKTPRNSLIFPLKTRKFRRFDELTSILKLHELMLWPCGAPKNRKFSPPYPMKNILSCASAR